jgi:hypothetical protein
VASIAHVSESCRARSDCPFWSFVWAQLRSALAVRRGKWRVEEGAGRSCLHQLARLGGYLARARDAPPDPFRPGTLVDKEVHDCLMVAFEIDALRLSRENSFLVLTIERET